jgi:DNA-binding Lrp family transcriptional regulator
MAQRKAVKAKIDRLDVRLMSSLAEHGRKSITELSKNIALSPTPLSARLDRLEAEQLILGYRADVDVEKLATLDVYYVTLGIKGFSADTMRRIEALMAENPYIVAVDCLFGSIDYVMLVYAKSKQHYHEILAPFLQFELDYQTLPVSRRLIRFHLHRLIAELGRDFE